MKTVVIDGDVLCNPGMDGIHRFMTEILKRIDVKIPDVELEIHLIHRAEKVMPDLGFKNIKVVPLPCGNKKYRMSVVPAYIKKVGGVYCSMSNDVAKCGDSIITIMDLIPLYKIAAYPFKSLMKMKIFYKMMKKYGHRFVTISEYSRDDICEKLDIPRDKIDIVVCGWEHMNDIREDASVLERNKIKKGTYYYAVGNQYPHKNFAWVKEVAKRNKDSYFVIAGKVTNIDRAVDDSEDNMRYIGYVTDEENKALMKYAKAFILPSKIEGFGIPPLEALSLGTPAIVASASCLPDIYGHTVHYIDPDEYDVILDDLISQHVASPEKLLLNNTWKRAASQWMDILLKAARRRI